MIPDLWEFLTLNRSFTLMLAPPGWGKTHLLLKLFKNYSKRFVFISPLRALAEEFFEKAHEVITTFKVNKRIERAESFKSFYQKERCLIILTPEMIDNDFLFYLEKTEHRPVVIFDEFHLFYYWGESFRPVLWDILMGVATSNASILGLSATMNEDYLHKWKRDFLLNSSQLFLLDLGNQKIKNIPKENYWFPSFFKKVFIKRFLFELRQNRSEVFVFFCRLRTEVDFWLRYCERENISALGCKGGEVLNFVQELKELPKPRCIFCTTSLSHGVNLPCVSKVFISYKVGNPDFWLQMVGRGGRRGEAFEIFSFDSYLLKKKTILSGVLRVIWFHIHKVLFFGALGVVFYPFRKNRI
jgi:ATP-dependent DNA helicase RecQ